MKKLNELINTEYDVLIKGIKIKFFYQKSAVVQTIYLYENQYALSLGYIVD